MADQRGKSTIDTTWSRPPESLDLPAGEIQTWLVRLDQPTSGFDSALGLDEHEQQRAARFVFDRDRQRYVRSHTVLRQLLGRYLGSAPEEVQLVRSKQGKPSLRGRPALTFNMSHSGNVGLFAISRQGPLGVDVEQIRASVDVLSLAERFFTPSESRVITAADGDDRLRYFFTAWVRKEAVIKAVGRGLAIPLSAVDVTPGGPAHFRTVTLEEDPPSSWQIADLPASAGYLAGVATASRSARIRCFEAPFGDLLHFP